MMDISRGNMIMQVNQDVILLGLRNTAASKYGVLHLFGRCKMPFHLWIRLSISTTALLWEPWSRLVIFHICIMYIVWQVRRRRRRLLIRAYLVCRSHRSCSRAAGRRPCGTWLRACRPGELGIWAPASRAGSGICRRTPAPSTLSPSRASGSGGASCGISIIYVIEWSIMSINFIAFAKHWNLENSKLKGEI